MRQDLPFFSLSLHWLINAYIILTNFQDFVQNQSQQFIIRYTLYSDFIT